MPIDRAKVLRQAQLLASRGQYDGAIAEWKKLATDTPGDGAIHNSIGDLQLKRNAPAEAASAFLQAASAFRAEGATLKAIAAFKKVLKCDPTRYEVYRHLGDLNVERGLVSSAVQDYLTLGKYYLKERRGKDALEIYKKIVTHDPSNLNAQQRVAELCVQENQQDEATKVYLQLGRERSAQGRHDEAKDAYLAVLRIDPANSEAAQFVESMKKGGTGPAKEVHSVTPVKSVKPGPSKSAQNPSEPPDHLAEVRRRIEEKQYAGAEAILNQMLTREPGNPQVCQLLARLHLQRGDVQVALGEYRFLAGAALRAHDLPLAESLIQEFLSAEPNSVPLLELNGELHEEKGDQGAAVLQYAKAIELLLEHPEPGMESLHEELFDKVRSLSTDETLVNRLAMRMKGEGVSPSQEVSSSATTQGSAAPAAELKASTLSSADAGETHEQGFSLMGAEPDSASPFAKGGDLREAITEEMAVADERTAQSQPVTAPQMPSMKVSPAVDVVTAPPVTSHPSQDTVVRTPATQTPIATQPGAVLRGHVPEAVTPSPVTSVAPQISGYAPAASKATPTEPAAPPPDYEAHYTLGVAYKNMGLYEEAKEQFQVSMNSDTFYLDSALMTAVCLKEEHHTTQAIFGLEAVLVDPRCQGAKGQAIRYELGLLYESQEQWEKAAVAFQSIPSFHDVPQRLAALKAKSPGGGSGFRYVS